MLTNSSLPYELEQLGALAGRSLAHDVDKRAAVGG